LKGRPLQRCPDCDEVLTSQHINLQEGVALCPACGQLSRLAEVNLGERSVSEILSQPVTGCTVKQEGQGIRVTASMH